VFGVCFVLFFILLFFNILAFSEEINGIRFI